MDLNGLDILIIAVLVFGIWRGTRQGAILAIARMFGLVVAFVLAVQLMDTAGLIVVSSLDLSHQIAPLVGFVIVFIGAILGITLMARFVEWLIGAIRLGGVNRMAGGVVGAAKAALLLSIVFLFASNLNLPSPDTRADSALFDHVEQIAPATWDAISTALPGAESLAERFGSAVNEELSERIDVSPTR